MTAKRDLKRRVRERQARTGESYVTARRHVAAGAPDASRAMDVVELVSCADEAAQLGLRCGVMMSPSLAERVKPATVVTRLREVLVGTAEDPSTAVLRGLALEGRRPLRPRRPNNFETVRRFLRRARAGLGGTTDDGSMMAFPVADRDGLVLVLCTAWHNKPSLVLTTLDEEELGTEMLSRPRETRLFMIFEDKRHEMTSAEFVIGRTRACDLQIRDGNISRTHAAVIRRSEQFYIKDLGSLNGILYLGMRIDNKRIDEGDVFILHDYELRFTYVASD